MPTLDDDKDLTTASDDSGSPASAAPAAPASIKDIIAQRLAQQDSQLKDSQNQVGRDRAMLGLAQGFGQMVNGLSRAGAQAYNPAPYKLLEANANQPVENLLQRQQAQTAGLGQLASEQKITDSANAQDPNSPRAKMLQALVGRINPKMQSNFAPEDFGNVTKILDTEENAKTRQEMAKGNNLYRQALLDDKVEGQFPTALKGNKAYGQADTTANSADALMDTVRNATVNKTSAQALPTELANFASRGQRLHQATVEAFQNPNSDLMARIKTALSKGSSGVIPGDVANDIVNYLQLEKNAAQLQRNSVMRQEAERFKSRHGRYPRSYDPTASATPATAAPAPSAGWSPAEEARFQELQKKLGGGNAAQ